MIFDAIIVGGGAAGLMAAGTAAEHESNILLLEKKTKCGRKLLLTGNSRCNMTNRTKGASFRSHFFSGQNFLKVAEKQFNASHFLNFCKTFFLDYTIDDKKRVFPASNKASDVYRMVINRAKQNGVSIQINTAAKKILIKNNVVYGIICKYKNIDKTLLCKKIIIATGGLSYPATGSTGDGYIMAREVGHTVVKCVPSLVALISNDIPCEDLSGISFSNITVTLWSEKKRISKEKGDILFTHFGLSGPAILTISRAAVELLNKGKLPQLKLDLFPNMDDKECDNQIIDDFSNTPKRTVVSILSKRVPRILAEFICYKSKTTNTIAAEVTCKQRKIIRLNLKSFTCTISGHRPIEEATVTAGGILLDEINPLTMESKLIKGLHFAGEVMDIDGDCGGFNLQAAWTTGFCAGNSSRQCIS